VKGANSNEKFIASDPTFVQQFNLLGNKSLRTLETTMTSINVLDTTSPSFLKTILSSITLSVPLDVVIIYEGFCGLQPKHDPEPICLRHSSQEIWDKGALHYRQQLEVFREIYKTREFRLVLCADVPDFMVEHGLEILGRLVEVGKAMGGLFHLHEPLIIAERRIHLTRCNDYSPGWRGKWYVPASAL
jgi:hypothetical protein